MEWFMSQPWYAMAGEMVMMANMLTMFIKKHDFMESPVLEKVITVLDWVSLNIFKNKNADK